MKSHHWLMVVVILVVGYLIGVWMPQYGQGIVAKLKGVTGQ